MPAVLRVGRLPGHRSASVLRAPRPQREHDPMLGEPCCPDPAPLVELGPALALPLGVIGDEAAPERQHPRQPPITSVLRLDGIRRRAVEQVGRTWEPVSARGRHVDPGAAGSPLVDPPRPDRVHQAVRLAPRRAERVEPCPPRGIDKRLPVVRSELEVMLVGEASDLRGVCPHGIAPGPKRCRDPTDRSQTVATTGGASARHREIPPAHLTVCARASARGEPRGNRTPHSWQAIAAS